MNDTPKGGDAHDPEREDVASYPTTIAPSSSTIGMGTPTNANEAEALGAASTVRTVALGMLAWCAIGVPFILFAPGTHIDRTTSVISLIVVGSVHAWLAWRMRAAFVIADLEIATSSVVVGLGVTGLSVGLGMYTPFVGILALGLLLYSSSTRLRSAFVFYAVGAISYAIVGSLNAFGVIASTGLLDPLGEPRVPYRVLNLLLVEGVYASSFAFGQLLRVKSASMMRELETAVRAGALRASLLDEVRAELDRAARLGGPGQFTGQTLGGYRLDAVIGRGGMGEVYAAERLAGGGAAAVKVIRRDVLSDPDIVQRFEREARLVASLASPHIVEVFGVGGRDAPLPFIAMERLYGVSLATKLRNDGILAFDEADRMLSQVCSGVSVAHAAGIIHRDLNPNNLFCAEDGAGVSCWKILDFGVAKRADGSENQTLNQIVGTPQYMAPEQISGDGALDARVDVYALTAMLYRALTGRPAFANGDLPKVLHAVVTSMPADPSRFAHLDLDVTYVLRIGLAKRREDRFDDVGSLAEAFSSGVRGQLPESTRAHARRLLELASWSRHV